jgi:restriction system protein
MGYGGTRRDAGAAIGGSGDGGIDGVINEDRLGLDAVYVQAKRWDTNSVGRPEIQKFAGALQGQRARKGIFITTSTFSKEAIDFASRIESRIILIDGVKLAQYMIDFNVGVTTTATYELKRVDSDYFGDR